MFNLRLYFLGVVLLALLISGCASNVGAQEASNLQTPEPSAAHTPLTTKTLPPSATPTQFPTQTSTVEPTSTATPLPSPTIPGPPSPIHLIPDSEIVFSISAADFDTSLSKARSQSLPASGSDTFLPSSQPPTNAMIMLFEVISYVGALV